MKHDRQNPFSIVILAAGNGKRMHSSIPKVLHKLGGKYLLQHVIDAALSLNPNQAPFIIIGHEKETIRAALPSAPVTWIEQEEQLGTGHAVLQALPYLSDDHRVLILCGDVPSITHHTLESFIRETPQDTVGIITTFFHHPKGFGRIIRNKDNHIIGIVEEKDANDTERAIQEINAGIYLLPVALLKQWLPQVKNNNTQKEFYLTDIIHLATDEMIPIHGQQPACPIEVSGVNDCVQLSQLERFYQYQMAEKWMQQGVTFSDPHRFDVRGEVTIGQDVLIDINVILEGKVTIGNHCTIGAHSLLRNVTLGDHVTIEPQCIIDGADIAEHATIGPFARIRPGTSVASGAHIGNFSEIKNSRIGANTKIHHVGYIGDSEIGEKTNIGAGTITCNYDGANKHKTIIGNNVFIGAHSTLIAPISIGDNATTGAGSVITRNAPDGALTLSRAEQKTIEHWKRKKKS